MTPKIINSEEKKMIGMRMSMNFANYQVAELWKNFMPKCNEINNRISKDLISLAVYQKHHFSEFNMGNEFEKWAAVEVRNFENIPQGMEALMLPAGLYAIFDYKGLSSDNAIFQYIYGTWLPSSEYELDNRPHFEVLGEKYKNNDPSSEEEIWIPIKSKTS